MAYTPLSKSDTIYQGSALTVGKGDCLQLSRRRLPHHTAQRVCPAAVLGQQCCSQAGQQQSAPEQGLLQHSSSPKAAAPDTHQQPQRRLPAFPAFPDCLCHAYHCPPAPAFCHMLHFAHAHFHPHILVCVSSCSPHSHQHASYPQNPHNPIFPHLQKDIILHDNDADLVLLNPDWDCLLETLKARLPGYRVFFVVPSEDTSIKWIRVMSGVGIMDLVRV